MCLPYSFNNRAMAQSYIVSIPLPALNQFEARLRHIISSGFFFYVSTDFSLSPAKCTFFWGQPGCLSHLPPGCLGSCRWPCVQSAYISSGGRNEAPTGIGAIQVHWSESRQYTWKEYSGGWVAGCSHLMLPGWALGLQWQGQHPCWHFLYVTLLVQSALIQEWKIPWKPKETLTPTVGSLSDCGTLAVLMQATACGPNPTCRLAKNSFYVIQWLE